MFPPTVSLCFVALTPFSAWRLAPPQGALPRWLPSEDWSKMRVTVQLVPAQKVSCFAESAKLPAALVEMAVVDRSDARCTR